MMTALPPLPEMPLLPITSEKTMDAFRALNVTESDIFVCSYPKSGTTWTQNLVCRLLAAHMDMELPQDWHLSQSAPFYEVNQYWNEDGGTRVPAKVKLRNKKGTKHFRVFNTHLRPHQLPTNAKCIYVMRDAMDVLASFYYHLANMSEADGGYSGTPENFCDDFVAGKVLYGKWQDHLEAWLGQNNCTGKHHSNLLLLLHYDEMKENLRKDATRIAQFIGVDETRINHVLDLVIPHSTFASMRSESWRYTPLTVEWKTDVATGKTYNEFIRSGRVGDGKSFTETYFSNELKNKWNRDLEVARNRWKKAGVKKDIILRYLG